MRVKVLTIWQPWASLIMGEHKRYETRSWATRYRGPLVIHAAARFDRNCQDIARRGVYAKVLAEMALDVSSMPTGVCLGVVDLVGVFKTDMAPERLSSKELTFGDFRPQRFAWQLENVRVFPEPVYAQGAQKLWWWDVPKGLQKLFQ